MYFLRFVFSPSQPLFQMVLIRIFKKFLQARSEYFNAPRDTFFFFIRSALSRFPLLSIYLVSSMYCKIFHDKS